MADVTAPSAAAPLLEMRDITRRFPGVLANDRISLTVHAGEIHGLLGENGAGKSTLMNVLYGLLRPDSGSIHIAGQEVHIRSPRAALEHGIGMVHQHFMLVPSMTVTENVALGLRDSRSPLLALRAVRARIADISTKHGLLADPDAQVGDLSVGMQQRVEILKLLCRGARILVLDEPTAVLTPQEWHELAGILRSLVAGGGAVVFITHKLHEMLEVADTCTVLRHGRVVGSMPRAAATKPRLASLMVGSRMSLERERPVLDPGAVVAEARDLRMPGRGAARLEGVSFVIREREILGVAGVDGNGQRELVEVLTGLRQPASGAVQMAGRPAVLRSPRDFAAASAAVIPEDRHHDALCLGMSLEENLVLKDAHRSPYSKRGVLDQGAISRHAAALITAFDIRAPDGRVRMRQLSGGNQQKAVLARELHRQPRFLVASQPTRGLDIGAMHFVHGQILEHRARGGGTLLISTELDEILALSDRIAVMVDGRFIAVLDAAAADMDRLGLLLGGSAVHE